MIIIFLLGLTSDAFRRIVHRFYVRLEFAFTSFAVVSQVHPFILHDDLDTHAQDKTRLKKLYGIVFGGGASFKPRRIFNAVNSI